MINVRKEKGMTSFGVISRMRRIFDQKKIGHTGTLDPDAEGVLPVCMGRGTKLVDRLSRGTKTYRAVLLLGVTTDTQDISGQVLERREVMVADSEVREAVLSFSGKQMQVPPMYSALKVDGKKLVDLARRGIEVERKAREVEFSGFEIHGIDLPRVDFSVTCSHGAYIRTLCEDIGKKLGTGGCMESLLRTRVEDFLIEDAMTLDEIAAAKEEADRKEDGGSYPFLIPPERFYAEYPEGVIAAQCEEAALNGRPVPIKAAKGINRADVPEGGGVRLYLRDGAFVGIYKREGGKLRLDTFYYEGIF
ncbi:MAG: tRNA pseudouridine(55) synthase TruB [Lachnospiraceae bacterium]|nr:tRNA pseudouridine(55) synthase TruB [Lachnospiraceae bacterium]